MINAYYDRGSRVWVAYISDHIGQLGDAEMAHTKELACFQLGLEMGMHPEKFRRSDEDH